MFHHDIDPATGNPLYSFWALPGSLDNAPVWRGVKWVWSGDTLVSPQWANGNNLLTNIYINRASLPYSPNPQLSLEDAPWATLVPTGIPGSTFNLGFTIPDGTQALLWGMPLRRVVSFTPGGDTGEFLVTGTTLQTGVIIAATDWFYVRVPLS